MDKKKSIFIGIIEENKYTLGLLKSLLGSLGYLVTYSNEKGNVIILNKDKRDLIVITMDPIEISLLKEFGLEFNFLIINMMDYKFHKDSFVDYQFTKCDYYIINSDEDNLKILGLEPLDGIVITYGFNSKATMTISSYIIEETMEASLCLQREIISLDGERVVSSEFIAQIDSKNKDHIYSIMATSILALILGEEIQFNNVLKF